MSDSTNVTDVTDVTDIVGLRYDDLDCLRLTLPYYRHASWLRLCLRPMSPMLRIAIAVGLG